MQKLDDTTYEQHRGLVQTVIGDEKQKKFLPRIKIKKWHNEANFSIGLAGAKGTGKVSTKGSEVLYTESSVTAKFYELDASKKPLAKIRRVAKSATWNAVEATAEYEMFNLIGSPGTLFMAHYIVPEPTLALFDLMPASMHAETSQDSMAKDFDYPDKSTYHPNDIKIPKHPDGIKVTRYYTPVSVFVNPMYMDEGLHNIDLQWHGTDLTKVADKLMTAIDNVLKPLGVETKRDSVRDKMYFKHKDRWVKFFSCQEETGGAYSYININCAYNKAYDFYKPDVEKDIRDQYAYGLQAAHPDIKHDIVNTVMNEFAKLLGIAISDEPYEGQELTNWKTIQKLQDNYDWLVAAKRNDANWCRHERVDGFEFEVIFDKKPASNEVALSTNLPKNVSAYYQAEIDFDTQYKTKMLRRHSVFKSLAIYHDAKRDNDYQTGKITHIYRPIAHDANGHSVFCDFKELEGMKDGQRYDLSKGLTIKLPQDFIDSATYPVTVDPTFGYSTAGASSQSLLDTILATQQAPTSSGNLTSVSYYATTAGGSANDEGAVYDSVGSFNRITYTAENTVLGASWMTMVTNNLRSVTNGTNYILAVWGTSTAGYGSTRNLAYDSTVGKTSYSLSSTYVTDRWPDTLSGASTQSSRQYSIYASYGVQYPIMVGSSVALPTANGRYIPFMAANDTAWSATLVNQDALVPVTSADFRDLKIVQTTAPGAGTSRTLTNYVNDGVDSVTVTVADTATSGASGYYDDVVLAGATNTMGLTTSGTPAASTPNRWRIQFTALNQMFLNASGGTSSTSANRFVGVQDNGGLQTTAAAATQIMPESGTLQNLYVKMSSALTSGSYTVEVYKNAAASGLKVTLDNANQAALDSTHTVTFAAGDTAYIQITPATPNAAKALAIGMEYVSGTSGNGLLLQSNNTSASNSATVYNNWYGAGAWNATEANVQALGAACKITGLYVTLSASPGTSKSRTITLRVNGQDTTATVAISGASTSGSWSGTIAISNDDLVCVSQTPSGTPTAATVKYGIVYTTVNASTGAKRSGMFPLMGVG